MGTTYWKKSGLTALVSRGISAFTDERDENFIRYETYRQRERMQYQGARRRRQNWPSYRSYISKDLLIGVIYTKKKIDSQSPFRLSS